MKRAIFFAVAMAVAAPVFAASPFVGRDWRSRLAKQETDGGGAKTDVAPTVAANTNQGTTVTSPACLNCDPPSIHLWAAYEGVINGASENQFKLVGGVALEAPLTLGGDGTEAHRGTTLGRAFARLTVAPIPGAAVLAPPPPVQADPSAAPAPSFANFNGFEGLMGVERVVGRSQGVSTSVIASVWLGTRFSTDPEPLDNMKHGWGVGVGVKHSGGSEAKGVCGGDSSIGDDGAVQCRTWGRVMMPSTKGIGSVYFDALLSFFQPQELDAAGQPVPSTKRHVQVLLGVGVNADALWAAMPWSN